MTAPRETGESFETVATVDELPEGTLLGARLASGEELCLFNYRGRIGAVRNVCTHAEFPLSDGSLGNDGSRSRTPDRTADRAGWRSTASSTRGI